MKIFQFDRGEKIIQSYGSEGLRVTRIAKSDGQERVPITAGWGVRWDPGESHTSGTETGFTALVVEGAALGLFEPEAPEP